jgi:hypothetical protein
MTGDRSALLTPGTAQFPSYGIAITGGDPTVELKNNIFYTTQTAEIVANPNAKSYAIGMVTTTFVNLDSDYNDFFSTGIQDGGFRSGSLATAAGTDYATVGLWSTAVADEANSALLGEVDPVFVSPLTNLHLMAVTSPVHDKGIAVSVLDDFDGQIRSVIGLTGGVPEIGADEFLVAVAADSLMMAGRVTTADGRGIRNAVVSITGGNLTQPMFATTASFGWYRFEGLRAGETYVVSVNTKRFVFSIPSRVISLSDNLNDVDFVAEP